MDITAILIFLAIGAVAGWLAGLLMRGAGFGLIGNIIVGIVGSVIGGWLFGSVLGISLGGSPLVTQIVFAVGGAAILLLIIGLVKKA